MLTQCTVLSVFTEQNRSEIQIYIDVYFLVMTKQIEIDTNAFSKKVGLDHILSFLDFFLRPMV